MLTLAQVLAWSAILTAIMYLTASLSWSRGWTLAGMKIAFGNREDMPPRPRFSARAGRAANNMLENMALLLAALAAFALAVPDPRDAGDPDVARAVLGANIFFWARLAYFPTYLAAIAYVRSALWAVGLAGIAMILMPAL